MKYLSGLVPVTADLPISYPESKHLTNNSWVTGGPQLAMSIDDNGIQCSCGRFFAQLNAYTTDQRTCKRRKRQLSSVLAKVKLIWNNRRKRHTSDSVGEHGDTGHVERQQPKENGLNFLHGTNGRNVSANIHFDR